MVSSVTLKVTENSLQINCELVSTGALKSVSFNDNALPDHNASSRLSASEKNFGISSVKFISMQRLRMPYKSFNTDILT